MVTGVAVSSFHAGFSQDSTKVSSFSVSGSADVYYRYDLAKTAANNLTSFTSSHNSFELGMASAKFDYKSSSVELVADLGFGKRAKEFSYNDEDLSAAIKQLYISYSPANWLKFTAGSWATHIGYEVVDAYANRNYSMSYMFTNGPFFHTGLKAEATLKASSFMIGVANPTDYKYVPAGVINKKAVLAQYAFAPSDHFKAWVNFVGGTGTDSSKSKQYDLVLTSKVSDKFSIAYNGTLNRTKLYLDPKTFDATKSWWGSAVYLNYDISGLFGLTLRQEYFSDEKQLKMYSALPKGGHIWATTLSANFRTDHFLFVPEVRFDKASEALFTDVDANPTRSAANILLAAIYQF